VNGALGKTAEFSKISHRHAGMGSGKDLEDREHLFNRRDGVSSGLS